MSSGTRGYHHGDLRRALLAAAVDGIGEAGPATLSLRDLARRAGVSHAAPAHHFGDKAGLLTAVAAEGFDLLAEALRAADGGLLELGVAYVGFAVEHRAHFDVMFRPDLHRPEDPDLRAARERSGAALRAGVASLPDRRPTADDPDGDALAAWSIVHGFATLWLAGVLPQEIGDDPRAAARVVIHRLFRQA
ncbi:TetR/AcrR family transcriptional regulator [Micromonospora endolithica]|uniref:TetR/AcrR family transcriptional regulator n=1 Tax=Micromonospora endolithica TaxID=230091 RepID=A0A3A9Z4W5_9ACTN|nr:TetR/AcrR family transcriptional regulator [Micromonospora endolithica]RKN43461.1 TetR/AcrR family transcriptional regulator [Micromonospora endolithica]TWJ24041.1 TetR family transcriptional regulator [Micromonospora endolithica]